MHIYYTCKSREKIEIKIDFEGKKVPDYSIVSYS